MSLKTSIEANNSRDFFQSSCFLHILGIQVQISNVFFRNGIGEKTERWRSTPENADVDANYWQRIVLRLEFDYDFRQVHA